MARKNKKNFTYMFPGSKKATRKLVRRNRIVAVVVGITFAILLALIVYHFEAP